MARKNYLFVCEANIHRSKTGKIVFEELSRETGLILGSLEDSLSDVHVSSSGISTRLYGNQDSVQYVKGDDAKYDLVFVFSEMIKNNLLFHGADPLKIIDLKIKDDYNTNDEVDYRELRKLLIEKLIPYLPEKKS